MAEPAFSRGEPFRQLEYIEEYVRDRGCRALLIEEHYVDRDYIEDHSLFYSRSFFDYANSCRRIHFFGVEPDEVRSNLRKIEDLCPDEREWRQRCGEFSKEAYLGFTVIKPLEGSPVGRTLLRSFGPTTDDGSGDTRHFPAVRKYAVHVGAAELEVVALPFQQQDVGVSACATTALWSALHKLRDHEEIGSPTPAQITTLATQYSLPFGRPMPSDEGLSLDQMCQALQALKVAPSLLHVDEFYSTRAFIYASLRSGFAPVLLLQSGSDEGTWHAVTGVGYRSTPAGSAQPGEAYDRSGDVIALYVHDDRVGPYQRVNLRESAGALTLQSQYGSQDPHWSVRYVLVPLHAKIRISVSGLLEIAIETLDHVRNVYGPSHSARSLSIVFESWIARPSKYLQGLLADPAGSGGELARTLFERVSMPRYVGIVRLIGATIGTIDVLIDTTSTMKNLNFLAIAHHGHNKDERVLDALSAAYKCEVFSAGVTAST